MSNTLRDFFADQYGDFASKVVANWGVTNEQLDGISTKLKPLHKKYLALACISSVASYRRKRSEYASSVVDVCQLAIILGIKGTENPANVLLRQAVELTLKHIYFLTHPTEYSWAQSRDNYRELGFQSLLEYMQKTDEFKRLIDSEEITDQLNHHYAILSRYVHVHSEKFQRFNAFSSTKSSNMLDKLQQVATTLWPSLICLLVVFSLPQYNRASDLEKRLIRSGLTPKFRRLTDAYLKAN